MRRTRKSLAFLFVIFSTSIVLANVLFLGLRSTGPKSVVTEEEPQSVLTEPPIWQKIGNGIVGKAPGEWFGWSVSLSSDGNTVAVGGRNGRGRVRIFQWTESTSAWTQMGADIAGKARNDGFGSYLSLSSNGKIVAVGSPGACNGKNGSNSGQVRTFQWTESTSAWTQMGADIGGDAYYDEFGSTVSLSSDGKTMVVGASPHNSGNPDRGGGHVKFGYARIFHWTESTSVWTQMGADIVGRAYGHSPFSGSSVSLSSDGKIVAVGADLNDEPGNGPRAMLGNVQIFQWTESTSAWTQMGADINGEAHYDFSGSSVSLSSDGKTVAIGAPGNGGNGVDKAGCVRIFQWTKSTSAWTQMGTIVGEAPGGHSGRSVALSSDGKTVAIGAPYNDRNGSNSGHVRIFQWAESTFAWTQMGADLDGEASRDEFGSSLSLSSDGKIMAVGAPMPYKDGGSSNSATVSAGHVRIFQWNYE